MVIALQVLLGLSVIGLWFPALEKRRALDLGDAGSCTDSRYRSGICPRSDSDVC